MSGSKRSVPFAVACLLASVSCTGAMAGQTSQSPLDPYSFTSPATQSAKGGGNPAVEAPQAEEQYVTMPAPEGKEGAGKSRMPKVKVPKVNMPKVSMPHVGIPFMGKKEDKGAKQVASTENVKKEKQPKEPKAPKEPKEPKQPKQLASKADHPGLVDKTKQLGSGFKNKTKEAEDNFAEKTRSLKEEFATDAKNSSNLFKKSAGAIHTGFKSAGDGIKGAGEKVKGGTEKVAHLGKKDSSTEKGSKPAVKSTMNGSPVAETPKASSHVKNQPKGHGHLASAGGFMNKLKFWGHDKGPNYQGPKYPTAYDAPTGNGVKTSSVPTGNYQ
ncbi:MAG TPA: hypothetical protein V6C81_15485 [Planktothrix sp.]|jgi:hypothetical protein